jgi:phosphatidylserine/phosphatidylglycerophosphate/cardiolipin synthase-like enzyme
VDCVTIFRWFRLFIRKLIKGNFDGKNASACPPLLRNGILNELGKKAEQGVEVKILYDDMGSRGLRKKGLRPFTKFI